MKARMPLKTAKTKKMNGTPSLKIRILLVAANPADSNPLKLDSEIREIEQAILKYSKHASVKIRKFQGLRITDLQHELLTYKPTHVHFSGHGNANGIALVDEHDNTRLVRIESLTELFRLLAQQIKCVFLNSCCSAGQSRLISKYIRYVVCMAGEVPDDMAIRFAVDFYAGIGAGRGEKFAFHWALTSMALNETGGRDIPHLFTKRKKQV